MPTNNDGPKCKDCGKYTERIGSFSACANEYCDRHCIPVDDRGMTEEEAQIDAIAPLIPDDDATGFSEYLDAGPAHNEFGYARND